MAFTASAQTPVFHEGFDAAQTKASTELGWYEFINTQEGDKREIVTEGQYEGTGCLQFFNSQDFLCENQGWQRAVKFRNLDLKEDTYYKVTFAFKGTNRYNATGEDIQESDPRCSMRVGLMQGGENSDISILDKAGNDQTKTVDHFNPLEYENYAYTFYFANKATQDEKYLAVAKNDPALVNNYFLTFNVINPGTFYLDDVNLVEVNNLVDAITYGGYAIRVKYLEETNIKSLIAKSPLDRIILPVDCATVTVGGQKATLEAVELHNDGYLYIFFNEDYDFQEASADKILVSFTNPENIIDLEGENSRPSFFAFTDIEASFDESVKDVLDFLWEPAQVIASEPVDGSFNLDLGLNEFTITFDHKIVPSSVKATLTGKDFSEELAVKEGQEDSEKIVLVRTGSGDLAKGKYKIIITNATTDNDIDWSDIQRTYQMSFEVGKVQVAETIYTDVDAKWMEGEYNTAQPTNGWISYFGGEVNSSNLNRVCNMITKDKGVGFYFCQRDNAIPAKLTFGEKEDAPLTLPAGNVQLTIWLTQWQAAGGSANYALYKKADVGEGGTPVEGAVAVVSGTAVGTENTTGFGANVDAITAVPVKIENAEAGEYVLVLEQNSGWSGTIIYGFDIKTYVVTEGEVNNTEILVDGTFTTVGNSRIPEADSGWRIYHNGVMRNPGGLVSWGADNTSGTGGGGPRIFALSYKNMAGKGIYLDANSANYATYGENLTYETEEGEATNKTLALDADKYQITYYTALWKAENVSLTMQILNEGGSVVYTRSDVIKTISPNGDQNKGDVEAMKVQFFWTPDKEGNYVIKFFGNGECFVGNFTLETTASMAVQYTNLLKAARTPAEEEYAVAIENDDFRGTTREALGKAIEDYTAPDFHTIAEYENAIAELEALTKAMKTRRDNIAKYPASLQGILDAKTAAEGTKYEGLATYPLVAECYDTYKDVDYIAMSDEDLAEAVAKMGDTGTMMKNMVEDCIPNFVIKQITELAGMITAIDPSLVPSEDTPEGEEASAKASITSVDATDNEKEILLAAGNAISDDQALVAQLKKVYAYKLYEKIAAGENPFAKVVEEEGYDPYTEATPINADAMIQNRGFYTDAQKQSTGALANANSFPGWNITITQNSILADWGWGGPYNCSAIRPISDAAVCTAWGTSDVDVNQLVNNLPVGVYNISIKVGDGTSTSDENLSYAYCKTNAMEEAQTIIVENDGGARNAQEKLFENISTDVDGQLGSMTIGAVLRSRGDFSKCDDAALKMVGALEGFDYAAAAKALKEEIVTAVKNVATPEGEPVKVQYFSLDGKSVATPAGITIKVATYKNGFMKVSKFIAK